MRVAITGAKLAGEIGGYIMWCRTSPFTSENSVKEHLLQTRFQTQPMQNGPLSPEELTDMHAQLTAILKDFLQKNKMSFRITNAAGFSPAYVVTFSSNA